MEYSAWPEQRTGPGAGQGGYGAAPGYGTTGPPPRKPSFWKRLFRGRRPAEQQWPSTPPQWPTGAPYPPPPPGPAPNYGSGPVHPPYGYPQYGYPQYPGYPQYDSPQHPGYATAYPYPPAQAAPAATPAPAPAAPAADHSHAPLMASPAAEPADPPSPSAASLPSPSTASSPHLRTAHKDLLPKALANLAMRDLTLVESLLLLIQRLEEHEDNADVLEILYQVDHLGTRMRRNCENLLVMAGEPIDSAHHSAVPLHNVARAAISEIDKYTRVRIQELPQLHIRDTSADDLSHLLAELMENSLANSSDDSDVVVRAHYRDNGGLIVEIADDGIGIPPDKLTRINSELREPPVLTDESLRHMGLFVVGLLAHRHGMEVQLQTRPFSGTSGYVFVPAEIVQVSQSSNGANQSGPPMPESDERPSAAAPPASGDSTRASGQAAATAEADGVLSELPKREPGRGVPGLRVVEGAAQSDPEPDRSPPANEPDDPNELPELPRRHPTSDEGPAGALPRRGTSGATAAPDEADGAEDEFVAVRGRPPGGTATSPQSGGDTLSHAERIRAEFDGYVSGRKAYEENPEPAASAHGAAEDGDADGAGGRSETDDETPDASGGNSGGLGRADQP